MLEGLAIALTSSYIAWFFKTHETSALYPFDSEYSAPIDPRLLEQRLDTPDGETLVIWHTAAEAGKPTLVYLPGNAGTLADRSTRFSDIIDAGFGLYVAAYRGSSGSTGRPNETVLTDDALRIAGLADNEPGGLVLYGESLGAAIAVKLAARGVGDAVALEAPFTSLPDLVDAQYPLEGIGDTITQRWDSLAAIRDVRARLMIIHGREDRLVPQTMGKALFDAAGSAEKAFIDVDARGHADLWDERVQAQLFDFLDRRQPGD